MITLLLVDDRPAIRQGLRMRLALEDDIQIVGEAGCGAEAIRQAAQLRPDVVLLDSEMPEMDGLTCAERLRAAGSGSAVVMLTLRGDAPARARAAAAGVAAFVEKCDPDAVLLAAIRQAAVKRAA